MFTWSCYDSVLYNPDADKMTVPTTFAAVAYFFFIEGSVFNLPFVCFQLHLVPYRRSQFYILLKFHAIEFPLWRLQIAILGPDTLSSLCHLSLSWRLTLNNSQKRIWAARSFRS